jgi:large subunit ribosomal protein L21
MAYAVIRTGGKQYRVAKGDRLRVEKIAGEPGAEFVFEDVLMVAGDGAPVLEGSKLAGAKVGAKVVRQGRGPKLRVLKFKRRKGFQKVIGHRQDFTEVEITSVP